MRFTLIGAEVLEGELHEALIERDGHRLAAVVIGALPEPGAPVDGEVQLDEIMSIRMADDDQGEGFAAGPGFDVVCGTIAARFEWGSYDLRVGDGRLMLDEDELAGWRPELGDRLSIGFKGLALTLD